MTPGEHEELAELLKESIRASNRTTHAVRAVVVPSTILLITVLIAALPAVFGLLLESAGWIFMAGFLLFIGSILAIASQIQETNRSAIPHSGESDVDGQMEYAPASGQEIQPAELCVCSNWERGVGNTTLRFGIEYCDRCLGRVGS
jgi:hypothetical protein